MFIIEKQKAGLSLEKGHYQQTNSQTQKAYLQPDGKNVERKQKRSERKTETQNGGTVNKRSGEIITSCVVQCLPTTESE